MKKYIPRDLNNNVIAISEFDSKVVIWEAEKVELAQSIKMFSGIDDSGQPVFKSISSTSALGIISYYLISSQVPTNDKAFSYISKLSKTTPKMCRLPSVYDWEVNSYEDLNNIDFENYMQSPKEILSFQESILQFSDQLNNYYNTFTEFQEYMDKKYPNINFQVDKEGYEIDWNYLAHYFTLNEKHSEEMDYWTDYLKQNNLTANALEVNGFAKSFKEISKIDKFSAIDEFYVLIECNPNIFELNFLSVIDGELALTQDPKEITYLFTEKNACLSIIEQEDYEGCVERLFIGKYKNGNLVGLELSKLNVEYARLADAEEVDNQGRYITSQKQSEIIQAQVQALFLDQSLSADLHKRGGTLAKSATAKTFKI